nr:acetolactate synthase large subunit [Mycobacterium sp. 3519A]
MTTGAEIVVDRLTAGGVEVCFANPGTSEMHFVAALDSAPQMRAVLCLFEGVATGAADGYARIAGKPAATLLHLGPGMANGLANLHNGRRAHSPIVNVVGDHATYHQKLDAPLQSDIDALGHWLTGTVHRPASSNELAQTVDAAVAAATLGRIATLVLPADLSWGDAELGDAAAPSVTTEQVEEETGDAADIAQLLKSSGQEAVLLLGGAATGTDELHAAARISAATGARVLIETFPARLTRGRGVPNLPRLGYFAELAQQQLKGARHLIIAGARSPVTFFAYPNLPGDLVPAGATVHNLGPGRLETVAELLGAQELPDSTVSPAPLPSGPLRPDNWAAVVGALLPEGAIISDEANTSGLLLPDATAASPTHDVLTLTGGAIGQGLPVAVGAAIAAPHRPVIALQSDGSAMYTISALWTMAREQLDITVVILDNRAYAILQIELARVGASAGGPKARSLLDLANPNLDFVAIAEGFGVPAKRATTAEELAEHFSAALAEPGPHLIDAVLAK